MFRITVILVQCLAKTYKNGSIVSVDMDKDGVMAVHTFTHTHTHTSQNMLP